MNSKLLCLVFCTLTLGFVATEHIYAQGSDVYGSGAKVKLNEDGSRYLRFITWHQFWSRYTEMNPGTTVAGKPQENYFDMGMRRSRFLLFGNLTPEVLIMFHIGINNQTFLTGGAPGEPTGPSKKPQLFIHDAWAEYKLVDKALYLGAGLHYWLGPSRKTNASTLNFMSLDAPIFNWSTIEATDQFARFFGFYAKGSLGNLDYQVSFNQPFVGGTALFTAPPAEGTAAATAVTADKALYNVQSATKMLAGYAAWQFMDKESMVLPFRVGSYLGTKKVFNVGAGFMYHPDAMWSAKRNIAAGETVNAGDIQSHGFNSFAIDAFLDLPLSDDRSAITAYLMYNHYDFGPNFLRYVGIMNIGGNAANRTALNPGGNAYPMIGTGDHVYGEVGYLFPKEFLGEGLQLQPIANVQYSQFEALDDPALIWEAGANLYLVGHHLKLTGIYRSRPIFERNTAGESVKTDSKGEFILQTMIYY